jgi:hypothetical protein
MIMTTPRRRSMDSMRAGREGKGTVAAVVVTGGVAVMVVAVVTVLTVVVAADIAG